MNKALFIITRRLPVFCAALWILLQSAGAATRYVDVQSTNPVPPYVDWSTASTNVQVAIDAATDGDLILVTNGIYALRRQILVSKGVTVASVNGAAATVIDGNNETRCFYLSHTGAVVRGFTITRGNSDEEEGGIYGGGGVYFNWAGLVSDCVFAGNHAPLWGGACDVNGAGVVRNCLIKDNHADYFGGGILLQNGGSAEECTIVNNSSLMGAGLYLAHGTVVNTIIYFNNVDQGALDWEADYGFPMTASHCCATPQMSGESNTADDPVFEDYSRDDFRLQPGSPCINSGTNSPWMAGATDLDGQPRIFQDRVDRGAFECSYTGALANLTVGGSPGPFGVSAPFAYGSHACILGRVFTNKVRTVSVQKSDTRATLVGWSGTGSVPESGNTNTVTFALQTDSTLTWNWAAEYLLDTGVKGAGEVSVVDGWRVHGESVLILASPMGDATFDGWTGDVPAGHERDNPVLLVMDQPRKITACFVAATHFVDVNGANPLPPYLTWQTAATNIQEAVNLAIDSDAILVNTGRYVITSPIVITNGITIRSVGGAEATVVDANRNNNCRCFYMNHSNAVVDGFTATRGYTASAGAGFMIDAGTVRNSTIISNTVTGLKFANGGGVVGGRVENCRILNNTCQGNKGGGAIGSFVINSVIAGNTARGGGGVASCTIVNCQVIDNTSTTTGGGIYDSSAQNSLILGNTTTELGGLGVPGSGGGVYGGSLANCTVVSNSSSIGGGACAATITNSVLISNTAKVSGNNYSACMMVNSCSIPLPPGTNNIDWDPKLRDVAARDCRPMPNSPCINAGTNLAWMAGATDLDGKARVQNGRVDIGAYETEPGPLECDFRASVSTGQAPLLVTFTALTVGSNLTDVVYQWDFDNDGIIDASGVGLQTVSCSYSNSRTYSVRLTVQNANGELDELLKQDYIQVPPYYATATAGLHGQISPTGIIPVSYGSNVTFTITPEPDYQIADVLVDGISVGATNRLTLANITTNHSVKTLFWGIVPWLGAKVIAEGIFFSLGLETDGSISFWGGYSHGVDTLPLPNRDFVAVAVAVNHALGLKLDGSIVAWGENGWGQLAVPTPNTDFVGIAAGYGYSLGLKSDGRIIPWGNVADGRAPVPAPNADFVGIAAGYSHSLGLKSDGRIVAWGNTSNGRTTVPEPNTNFIAVAAGYDHSLGLKSDGSVVAWGWGAEGQTAVPEPNTNFIAVAAGYDHSLGLKSDGSVVAWGRGVEGQTTVPEPNTGFVEIAAGYAHSLGLKSDGSIVVWGSGEYSATSIPSTDDFGHPSVITPRNGLVSGDTLVTILGWNLGNGTDVTNVTICGVEATIVTQNPWRVVVRTSSASGPRTGDVVVCSVGYGRITKPSAFTYCGPLVVAPVRVTNITATSAICTGEVLSDGGDPVLQRGLCWGTATNPTVEDSVAVSGAGAGIFDGVVLQNLTPGTLYHVRAWATNNSSGMVYGEDIAFRTRLAVQTSTDWYGRISPAGVTEVEDGGNVTFTITPDPGYQILDVLVDGISIGITNNCTFENMTSRHKLVARFCGISPCRDAHAVAAGLSHSLGLKSDGSIVAWGDNSYGQTNVPSPNAGFVAVAAGYRHSLGLKLDGSIVAWGDNSYGQTNVPLPNADFVAVAAGGDCSLGLKSDGSIVAWGENYFGQTNVPASNANFVGVAAAPSYSLGLKSDGTIVCWGYGAQSAMKVPTPNADFVAVAAQASHALGLKSDGRIAAWGGLTDLPLPNEAFVGLAAGFKYSLGLKGDGSIVAWGAASGVSVTNVPSPNAGFTDVAGGYDRSLALKGDGSIAAWCVSCNSSVPLPNPNTNFGHPPSISPSAGLIEGGTTVTICGWNLGNGSDVTNVTLCGANATILSQNPWRIVVRTGPAASPTNGSVVVYSASAGAIAKTNSFGYYALPIVTTLSVSNVISYRATAGGEVLTDGGDPAIRRGLCWGTEPNPTVLDSVAVTVGGTGVFSAVMNNLSPGVVYHVRAWARNAADVVAYGSDVVFRTPYAVTARFGPFGSILPRGIVDVEEGGDVTFSITADEGGRVATLVVDGLSIGATNRFTFSNVTANHTISATFCRIGPWRGANSIASGGDHSLGLKSDGSIIAWGENLYGETNVPAPNADFVAVSAGYYLSLGLKSDSSIVAWGYNGQGQATVPEPNTGFVAIAGGYDHALGLKSDGSVAAWGWHAQGQTTVPAPNADFVAVAAGMRYSLGLKADGHVVSWGESAYGKTAVPSPNSDFVAIASGLNHALGLKSDGSIVAWGDNRYGQTNVPEPNTDFVAVEAGWFHSLGLKSDGSVVIWGQSIYGMLNVPEPNADFAAVSAGYAYTLGLKSNGVIVAWGWNRYGKTDVPLPDIDFGQPTGIVPSRGPMAGGTTVTILGENLGNGTDVTNVTICGVDATIVTQSTRRIVVQTGAAAAPTNGDVVVYSAGYGPITRAQSFRYWGPLEVATRGVTNITAVSAEGTGEVVTDQGDPGTVRGLCWGTEPEPTVSNSVAECGLGVGVFSGVPLAPLAPGTVYHVRAWATNAAAGLVYGEDLAFRTRLAVSASAAPRGSIEPAGIVEVDDGGNAVFMITADPDCQVVDVLVDGIPVGPVGSYTFENVTACHTIRATFAGIGALPAASAIAAGGYFSMALKSDGRILAWGDNVNGQTNVPAPNEGFVSIAAGGYHAVGLRSDGSVLVWGDTFFDQDVVPSPNTDFVAVAAGGDHSLGLKLDGSLLAWGDNSAGQSSVPGPNADFAAIAAGWYHSLGLKTDGRIVAWGTNSSGQLDVPLPNAGFVAVGAGVYHSLGIKAGGRVVGWGNNGSGQLNVPEPNRDFVAVAAGWDHSVGLKSDGSIVAWGANNYGQTNVPLPNTDFVAVSAGFYHSMGMKSDGSIVIWGRNNKGQTNAPAFNADFGMQTGIAPNRGPATGGTTVTILGANLSNGSNVTHVTVCGIEATIVSQTLSAIVVVTGPAPGPVLGDVVVQSSAYGSVTRRNGFAYCVPPTVRTGDITGITTKSAIGAGEVTDAGGDGLIERGLCWGTQPNPTLADSALPSGRGVGAFSGVAITNLSHATTYHVRAWARNAAGTGYGDDVSFVTHFVITAGAGPRGTIAPAGAVEVADGESATFIFAPDPGCSVAEVLVDGAPVGVTNRYTFEDVGTNHTIKARFAGAGGRWRFAVLSDSMNSGGTNATILTELARAVAFDEPDLVLFCGDLIGTPNIASYQVWTNAMAPLYDAGIGVYPVRGNHETQSVTNWRAFFSYLPANGPSNYVSSEIGLTYSFTNREALFIGLDQFTTSYRVNQAWLDAQLAAATQPFVFVFGHAPAFPSGSHVGSSLDQYSTNRNVFWGSLATAGAAAYFCGHEGFYDHARADDGDGNPFNDVHQFIVGTAGEALEVDKGYKGNNGAWSPVRLAHTNEYGYLLGEVNGGSAAITWRARLVPGMYQGGETSVLAAACNMTSSAELHGSVAPRDRLHILGGSDVTYTFTPDPGFRVATLFVDGVPAGPADSYTFQGLQTNHTISARFWGIGVGRAVNSISAGGLHSLALKSDGRAVGWGSNVNGQTNAPATNAVFVSVAAGGSPGSRSAAHSLALTADGRILGWGSGSSGQITVPAPNADFVAVAAGSLHSLGLKSDGRIIAWGGNTAGQLAVPAPNTNFVAAAACGTSSFGLTSDGRIIGWGGNTAGQLTVPAPNTNFVAVAAGGSHTLGLKTDGTVVAWGSNANGQTNVPATNANFVAVAAGATHSLGLQSDGSIVAWGDNAAGQLAVPAPNADFVAVAAGGVHSLGLKSDGTIVGWGGNANGQTDVPAPNAGFGQMSGVVPPAGPRDGGTKVFILGWNLGSGTDVTNVTLRGTRATLLAQNPWGLTIETRRAVVPGAGDAVVESAGYGSLVRTNAFTYLADAYTPSGTSLTWLNAHGLTNDLTDTDGDGMPEWAEYVAGTDPRNGGSAFVITNAQPAALPGNGGFVVYWPSVVDRTYAVDRTTNLRAGGFAPVASNLPSTPPVNIYTDVVPDLTNAVYRIRATLAP